MSGYHETALFLFVGAALPALGGHEARRSFVPPTSGIPSLVSVGLLRRRSDQRSVNLWILGGLINLSWILGGLINLSWILGGLIGLIGLIVLIGLISLIYLNGCGFYINLIACRTQKKLPATCQGAESFGTQPAKPTCQSRALWV